MHNETYFVYLVKNHVVFLGFISLRSSYYILFPGGGISTREMEKKALLKDSY
jgi:hypothetical protein